VVYFALKPAAVREAIESARTCECAVWVGSDAVTADEHQRLVAEGVRITRFSSPLSHVSPEELEGVVGIIEEHHPGETVWVERVQPRR